MRCTDFRDTLIDFVDGTLSPAALDAARAHERTCSECAALARAVREQSALLARLARPAPPADMSLRIERALGARGKIVRLPRRRAWAAAAAAAIIVAVGLLAAPRERAPERSVQIVDVKLPDRGWHLGRISPNIDNPTASLLDPLDENP